MLLPAVKHFFVLLQMVFHLVQLVFESMSTVFKMYKTSYLTLSWQLFSPLSVI